MTPPWPLPALPILWLWGHMENLLAKAKVWTWDQMGGTSLIWGWYIPMGSPQYSIMSQQTRCMVIICWRGCSSEELVFSFLWQPHWHCLKPLSLSDNDPTQVTTFPHPFYIILLIKYMNTKHREEKPKNCHFMVLYCHAKPTISTTNSFCVQAKMLELCFGLCLEEAPSGTSELISLPP